MEDLSYFLNKPGFLDKIEVQAQNPQGRVSFVRRLLRSIPSWVQLERVPLLLVVTTRATATPDQLQVESILGCSLVYEYRALGISTKTAASNDRSGRNTLIAPLGQKAEVATSCIRALLKKGMNLILLSTLEDTVGADGPSTLMTLDLRQCGVRWASCSRSVASYLPLAGSYAATLAGIGQKTRSNLRYYRKRAERELGCFFVPEVRIGELDFFSFNRGCMYPVSERVAKWRYGSLNGIASPFFSGVKDKEGRWLSLVGGRRTSFGSEILWQMNLEGLRTYSLSTVMRSYLIEREVGLGASRLYVEGGTGHSLSNSFASENLVDVLVMRRSIWANFLRALAERFVPAGNELVSLLSRDDVKWQHS